MRYKARSTAIEDEATGAQERVRYVDSLAAWDAKKLRELGTLCGLSMPESDEEVLGVAGERVASIFHVVKLLFDKSITAQERVKELEAIIPEGCTPSDATVLREANAKLAQENFDLQETLTLAEENGGLIVQERDQLKRERDGLVQRNTDLADALRDEGHAAYRQGAEAFREVAVAVAREKGCIEDRDCAYQVEIGIRAMSVPEREKQMGDKEMFAIMDGMDEVYRAESARIAESAPRCHMRPMFLDSSDAGDYHTETWWECSVCGHTKPL